MLSYSKCQYYIDTIFCTFCATANLECIPCLPFDAKIVCNITWRMTFKTWIKPGDNLEIIWNLITKTYWGPCLLFTRDNQYTVLTGFQLGLTIYNGQLVHCVGWFSIRPYYLQGTTSTLCWLVFNQALLFTRDNQYSVLAGFQLGLTIYKFDIGNVTDLHVLYLQQLI